MSDARPVQVPDARARHDDAAGAQLAHVQLTHQRLQRASADDHRIGTRGGGHLDASRLHH